MLIDELAQLEVNLRELKRKVVSTLLPGAAPETVSHRLGVDVPASVIEWFSWCNGVAVREGQIQDDVNVIPGYNPISLDEAVAMRALYADDAALRPRCAPLLRTASGDAYVAVWNPGEEAVVAGVLAGEPTDIEYTSIDQMMGYFNACFREGIFFVNGRGYLDMSADAYDELYARTVAG
jgi:hypothetical protein